MDKDKLTEKFIEEIIKNQKLNGATEAEIDKTTKPIGGLASFDSLTAIEVLMSLEVLIEEDLEIDCALDVSLFFTDKGRSALGKKVITHESLTIEEIIDNICKTIEKWGYYHGKKREPEKRNCWEA